MQSFSGFAKVFGWMFALCELSEFFDWKGFNWVGEGETGVPAAFSTLSTVRSTSFLNEFGSYSRFFEIAALLSVRVSGLVSMCLVVTRCGWLVRALTNRCCSFASTSFARWRNRSTMRSPLLTVVDLELPDGRLLCRPYRKWSPAELLIELLLGNSATFNFYFSEVFWAELTIWWTSDFLRVLICWLWLPGCWIPWSPSTFINREGSFGTDNDVGVMVWCFFCCFAIGRDYGCC